MLLGAVFGFLLAAIQLDGVSGDRLSVDAAFDANNVRMGDPMQFRIDFLGADLDNLHPPALASSVDARIWKIDDASAKTITGNGIRRLVYRVRPLREGLQTFPSLAFSYARPGQAERGTCATPPIPVHVKPGQQAALSGAESDALGARFLPDGIRIRVDRELGEDEAFAWRRACAKPTAEAFAKFDFPEARLNEAAALTLAGNWAKALRVYSRLEWQIGQTPEIERGIVAALDAKTDGQVQTLPAWRVLLRPVLRYAALGRVSVLLAAVALFLVLVVFCRRLIRALACLAVMLTAVTVQAQAQDPFDLMNQQMERMFQQMQQLSGRGGNGVQYQQTTTVNGGKVQTTKVIVNGNGTQQTIVNGESVESFRGDLSLGIAKADPRVGETFELVLSFEHTKGYTVEDLRFGLSDTFCLATDSRVERLSPGTAANSSNVVDRFSVRVHYNAPRKLTLTASVSGFARKGSGFFSFGQSFSSESNGVDLEIRPLPTDHQPADFAGAVGSLFRIRQSVDRNLVETNDVVTVTRTVEFDGLLPRDPRWSCVTEGEGRTSWREYVVADGKTEIPPAQIVYYDVGAKTYRTATSKGVRISYGSSAAEAPADIVVDAAADSGAPDSARSVRLRFYPSDAAPVVGETAGHPRVTEERGVWMRVDDGRHAGWVRKEELR